MSKISQRSGYITSLLTIIYFIIREGLRVSGTDWPDWLFPVMRGLLFGAAICGVACLLSGVFAYKRQAQECSTSFSPVSDKQNDLGWALSPELISLVTQRVLGILWLVIFGSIIVVWVQRFLNKSEESELYFRLIATPCFLFGAIASFFLFRGARWARIAVGILAILTVALVLAEASTKREWPDEDGFLGLFALVSALVLLLPRRRVIGLTNR